MRCSEPVPRVAVARRSELHAVFIKRVVDRHLTVREAEPQRHDRLLRKIPVSPSQQLHCRTRLPDQCTEFVRYVVSPRQMKVRPVRRTRRIDGVPGDRELVELPVLDLDLFALEVQDDRAVCEPLVLVDVPHQQRSSQSPAGEAGQPIPMSGGDCRASAQPLRPVPGDSEVEHPVIVPDAAVWDFSGQSAATHIVLFVPSPMGLRLRDDQEARCRTRKDQSGLQFPAVSPRSRGTAQPHRSIWNALGRAKSELLMRFG